MLLSAFRLFTATRKARRCTSFVPRSGGVPPLLLFLQGRAASVAHHQCQSCRPRTRCAWPNPSLKGSMNSLPFLCVATAVSLGGMSACSTVTPQQNLNDQLAALEGKRVEIYRYPLRSELLLSERQLENGNLERRYRYLGDCVFVLEVDPVSGTYVRAGAVGSEKSCILPP